MVETMAPNLIGVPFVPYFAPATGAIIPVSPAASSFEIATVPTATATPGFGATLRRAAMFAAPLSLTACNRTDALFYTGISILSLLGIVGSVGLGFMVASARGAKRAERAFNEGNERLEEARQKLHDNPYGHVAQESLAAYVTDVLKDAPSKFLFNAASSAALSISWVGFSGARRSRKEADEYEAGLRKNCSYALALSFLCSISPGGFIPENYRNLFRCAGLERTFDELMATVNFIKSGSGLESVRDLCMRALPEGTRADAVEAALLEFREMSRYERVKLFSSSRPGNTIGAISLDRFKTPLRTG